MKTVNHEYYVSLEVAKLLKKAGFDWETKNWWDYCKPIDEWSLRNYPEKPVNWNSKYYNYDCSAPTLEVAQRWLREVKNVDVFAYRNEPKDNFESIVSVNKKWSTTGMCINTYEEALETGIKKALELILEKGK